MPGRPPSPRQLIAPTRWIAVAAAFVVLAAVLVPLTTPPASAAPPPASAVAGSAEASAAGSAEASGIRPASLDGFRAGNIMSDAVFFDSATMTADQIDAFFRGKVASCLPGYTCLKDYRQNTPNRQGDQYCSGYTGGANESAATIIAKVARSCGINPQVFIVMLQKEQGLVTHTWPSSWRYDMALGQGCPDDAPCDPQFSGFFYQIYGAGRQMKMYTEGRWFTWFAPGNTWNVQYNPDTRCGSGPVFIENAATAALYYYTPYQPNAAALRAGYGEGDSCSAYGNRNFYNYFTDWFGSTRESTVPRLDSLDTSSYVTAVDGSGTLWGYPFREERWGVRVALATGLDPKAPVLMPGDLNGDGHRDLLIRTGGTAYAMYGTGSGFSSPVSLGVDWRPVRMSTAAGDFDSDGVPDVLTVDTAGNLMLWAGDDAGGLRPAVRVGWGWGGMNALVGGIDLSGDGNVDLIGRDTAGQLFVYYGDGARNWVGSRQIGQGWGGMTAILSPGDYDRNGTADVFARTANGDLWRYDGAAPGILTGGTKVGNGWQIMTTIDGAGPAAEQPRALRPGAGDIDADGAPDLVGLLVDGTVKAYRGDGLGGWRGTAQLRSEWDRRDRILGLGDFTGDGQRDIGRIDQQGRLLLYPGGGASGLGEPRQIGNGWQTLNMVIAGIDYDGDRNPDIIARDGAGRMLLYRGDGRGSWAETGIQIGNGWSDFTAGFAAGDFDGDGHADLLMRRSNGDLWLYPTDGAGSWGTPRQVGNGWSGLSLLTSPGDFDRDGHTDVIGRASNGDLILFSGDGSGGWRGSRAIGNGWTIVSALT
ncbi:hypothetical protein J2Y69_000891 [Microbacterium resistens]|uniref:Repeat domain-containing protein n=1 Tax=Microbacterium resistens TaxID=156977 RepID=A0ABU1S9L2_9MICO|nr:VCBS repeat-containing protein [Microbacterium resistens]MDR6866299.1 hypothetical protein [Microbacterium resistens]